jgi:hypothetical protein
MTEFINLNVFQSIYRDSQSDEKYDQQESQRTEALN